MMGAAVTTAAAGAGGAAAVARTAAAGEAALLDFSGSDDIGTVAVAISASDAWRRWRESEASLLESPVGGASRCEPVQVRAARALARPGGLQPSAASPEQTGEDPPPSRPAVSLSAAFRDSGLALAVGSSPAPLPLPPAYRETILMAPGGPQRLIPVEALARRARWNAARLRCGRSRIDGTGLFATTPIQAEDVLAEYVGEVVSNAEADERQRRYGASGLADFMFRVDRDEVIDATVNGARARYMNHSCEPNCFAVATLPEEAGSVVAITGHKLADLSLVDGVTLLGDPDVSPLLPATAESLRSEASAAYERAREAGRDPVPPLPSLAEWGQIVTAPRFGPAAPAAAPGAPAAAQAAQAAPRLRRVFVYTSRPIAAGEEITYDYQFAPERAPVPCRCGARACRGTLNLHPDS